MHTNTRPIDAATKAAQRRRRHLSVYRRALLSVETPEQRAAVASRYRWLFAAAESSAQAVSVTAVSDVDLDRECREGRAIGSTPVAADLDRECREGRAIGSTPVAADLDRECREGRAIGSTPVAADLDRECREVTVTVAA